MLCSKDSSDCLSFVVCSTVKCIASPSHSISPLQQSLVSFLAAEHHLNFDENDQYIL